MPEAAARRRMREAREQATTERLAAEAEPAPRPLGAKREQQIRDLPTQINHSAWSAAYDAGNAIRDLVRELDRLRGQLAEGFGEPELQHRLIGVSGDVHTPTERDLVMRDEWLPGVRHEVRDVYPTPWRAADDAQPATREQQ